MWKEEARARQLAFEPLGRTLGEKENLRRTQTHTPRYPGDAPKCPSRSRDASFKEKREFYKNALKCSVAAGGKGCSEYSDL